MDYKSKMFACKAAFITLTVVACLLLANGLWPVAAVLAAVAFVMDFSVRRCPFCGKHFSITENKLDYCPHCGKKLTRP